MQQMKLLIVVMFGNVITKINACFMHDIVLITLIGSTNAII